MPIFTAIGTAVAGVLFAGSALAASVIAGGLAFGASQIWQMINRPKASRASTGQPYSAVQGQVQFGANVPVGAMFGAGKVMGHQLFYAKYGSGNKFNAEVFVLSNGWCDGLEPTIYFYGQKYALTTRAIIGNEVAHYGVSGFGSLISIRFYDGRPGQAVDTKLVADTAALGNKWKATSVGAGLTYVVVEREYDAALFDKGRPQFEFVLRGLREYDPRKDDTIAGGSGDHRLDDPATWEFSTNPPLHRLNYQLGLRGLISGRTLIGEGKSLGQIDLGSYFAAMNVCDTPRNGKPTYACSLYVTGDDDHTEVLKEFDDAMAGYALNRRGLSGVIPGAPQIPVLEITADDIPTARAQEMQRRKSAFDLYNYLSGQFTSPESLWNPESLTPVTVNLDVAADGRPRQTSNDFLQVTDADTAQYLLNIRYRQNRKGGSVTLPVSRRVGFRVQEGEWVLFDGTEWLVSGWRCDGQFRCTLQLSETGADIYSEEGIEPGPIVVPPTAPVNPSLLSTVQDFGVEVGTIEGEDGQEVPALKFFWEPPEDPTIVAVRFFYAVGVDPNAADIFEDQCSSPEAGTYTTTKNVVPGAYYIARATIRTVPDRLKINTPWVVTVEPTGGYKLDIDLSNVAQDVLAQLNFKPRQLIEQFKQFGTLLEEVDRENYTKRETLFREITVQLEGLEASFTEVIEVALGPGGAIAQKLESLYTAMGGNDAAVNVRWTAEAGPDGYSARYTLQAAVNDGTFRAATFFLDVPEDPDQPTRIGMMAGQVVNYTSAGVPLVLLDENGVQRSANNAVMINWVTGAVRFSEPS